MGLIDNRWGTRAHHRCRRRAARILPDELPFRGHTLKRVLFEDYDPRAVSFWVFYKCDQFFNCDPPVRPWYAMVRVAERFGYDPELVPRFIEAKEKPHDHLVGWMSFSGSRISEPRRIGRTGAREQRP